MATVYQICESKTTEAAETWYNFDAIGISSPNGEYVIDGVDTFSLTVTGQTAFTDVAPSLFTARNVLRIARIIDGGTREYLFLGRVEMPPERGISGTEERYAITLRGIWDWFDNTPMRQQWTETAGTISKPRAILFCGPAGARMTTGMQLRECIAVAREAGCPVALPAAGNILTGFTPPFDEQPNISVAQAIIKCLVNHPHAALWVDYTTREPEIYVKARTDLSAVSVDIAGRGDIRITPRTDQQPPCIALCFEKSYSTDGATSMGTTIDYAPVIPGEVASVTDARLKQVDALWGVYSLDGSSASYKSQKIVVKPLIADGNWSGVAWWKARIPWLSDYDNADITLTGGLRSGDTSLANILTEGTVQGWMHKAFERQLFTIEAKLERKVSGSTSLLETKKLSVELPMTDATSKTYRQQSTFDPGETIPVGVAAALWAEFQQLHYDGTLTNVEQEPAFALLPGKVINLTSGMDEWAAMAAMINRVSIDFDSGTTSVQFGIPKWIDLDSRVAWYRNCNARAPAWSRTERAEPDEPEPEGTEGIATIRDGESPKLTHRLRALSDGDPKHIIDINPSALTGDAVAEMKPREIKILSAATASPKTLTQSTYQIMATAAAPEPETITLPVGGDVADLDVITSIKAFGASGSKFIITCGTNNTITGDAGDDITKQFDIPEVTVVTETGYGNTAFFRTKQAVRVLSAEAEGAAADYVTLISHASQHTEE